MSVGSDAMVVPSPAQGAPPAQGRPELFSTNARVGNLSIVITVPGVAVQDARATLRRVVLSPTVPQDNLGSVSEGIEATPTAEIRKLVLLRF